VDNALSQVIDCQLSERTGIELASAYRALCCAILVRTAMIHAAKPTIRREEIEARRVAQNWARGDHGVITFGQVCDALDCDPDVIRRGIAAHVEKMSDPAIRKSRKPKRHYIFGRNKPNAKHPLPDSPAD
jgi:hypothetical protein